MVRDELRGAGGDRRLFLCMEERALVERLLDDADLRDGAAEALLSDAFLFQMDDVLADGFGRDAEELRHLADFDAALGEQDLRHAVASFRSEVCHKNVLS